MDKVHIRRFKKRVVISVNELFQHVSENDRIISLCSIF